MLFCCLTVSSLYEQIIMYWICIVLISIDTEQCLTQIKRARWSVFFFIKMYKRDWNESNTELSRLQYMRHTLVNFFASFDMVVFGWYLSTWFSRSFNWYSFDFDLIFIAAALNNKSKTKTNAVLFSGRPAVLLEWFTHSSVLNENNSI